jgi:methyl-accepting chemotaxis protein
MSKVLESLPDRLNQIDGVANQLQESTEIQNRTVNGIDVIVKELRNILDRNYSEMKDIRADFVELYSKVKESLHYMSELHTDIKSIQDVIYQINLLSLNISIEAVKVGEYGKPFSSISGEIRTLNDKSKETLHKIENRELNGCGVSENSKYITENILPKLQNSVDRVEKLLEEKSKPLLELKQIEELNSLLDNSVGKSQELSTELRNITSSFDEVEREPIVINSLPNSESGKFQDRIIRKEDSNNAISRKLVEF